MSDRPETIWAYTYDMQQDDMIWDYDIPTWSATNPAPIIATEYRRSDLPPTPAQIMADPRVQALVKAGVRMRDYFTKCRNDDVYAVADFNAALAALESKP